MKSRRVALALAAVLLALAACGPKKSTGAGPAFSWKSVV